MDLNYLKKDGRDKKVYREIIEPRYAETDMMGVVYHANYLIWCEIARTGLYRYFGYIYSDLKDSKILWPVRRASLDYRRPAIYGSTISVEIKIKTFSGARLIYNYELRDEEDNLLATAVTEHAVTDKNFKVINLYKHDPELARKMDEYIEICKKD